MAKTLSAVKAAETAPVVAKATASKASLSFYEVLTHLTLNRKRGKTAQSQHNA